MKTEFSYFSQRVVAKIRNRFCAAGCDDLIAPMSVFSMMMSPKNNCLFGPKWPNLTLHKSSVNKTQVLQHKLLRQGTEYYEEKTEQKNRVIA